MIKKIELQNIKCFPKGDFEMSPLTVFCGANSAGKSTAIQCMLLLKQTFDSNRFSENKIHLSGKFFSVGHVFDFLAQNTQGDRISIKIDDDLYESLPLSRVDNNSYSLPLEKKEYSLHPFLNNDFHYLSAYRLSPQNSYDVNFESEKIDFGIYGEYVIAELEKHRLKPAKNLKLAKKTVHLTRERQLNLSNANLVLENDSSATLDYPEDIKGDFLASNKNEAFSGKDSAKEFIESRRAITGDDDKDNIERKQNPGNEVNNDFTLELAVRETMKRICHGFDMDIKGHTSLDKVSNSFRSSDTRLPVRPINTGFGISYVLPIVVAALCTPEGGTLIIENPEVHLHPSAQAELANFLGHTSLTGVQVIIETHSDHIINGIRVFAKDHALDEDHITINNIRSKNGSREITSIKVNSEGDLSDYQDGFFDQAEKDLMRLFE